MRKEKRQFLCKYSIFFAGLSRSSTYLCRYTYLHTSTNTVGCIPHTTIFACFLPTTHTNTTVGRYPIPTFLYSKFSVPLFVPLISFNFVLLFSLCAFLSFNCLSLFVCPPTIFLSFNRSCILWILSLSECPVVFSIPLLPSLSGDLTSLLICRRYHLIRDLMHLRRIKGAERTIEK